MAGEYIRVRRVFRTMKRTLCVSLLVLLSAAGALAQHAPGDGAPYVDPGVDLLGHARLFLDFGDLDTMFEYVGRYDADQRLYDNQSSSLYNSVTAGAYYRILPNLKAGLFYRMQLGARHDNDWVDSGTGWVWLDTSGRLEHVLIADLTPRFLLPFLPGASWVISAKTRYEVTIYNDEGTTVNLQSLFVRPGLTWFLIRDREPVLNVSAQYGIYVPVNFSENVWYQHGPYVNVLYHVIPGLSVDLGVSYQSVYWSESSQFDAAWPNNRYEQPIYRHWALDLGVIYQLDF